MSSHQRSGVFISRISPIHTRPLRNLTLLLLLLSSLACARRVSTAAPAPVSLPEEPRLSLPARPTPGTWSFKYLPGLLVYRIARSAAIESLSDSVPHREISTNLTRESIQLTFSQDSALFTASVDTFSVTTQGMIGPVQSVQLPYQLAGVIGEGGRPELSQPLPSAPCNTAGSVLVADIHNLLSRFPTQLTSGMSWKDTLDVSICQALLPATTHTIRSYIVVGAISFDDMTGVVIQRADTVMAHAEGAQQQHHLIVDASGSGTATYYLEPASGRILKLTTEQSLILTITAANKPSRFRQTLHQNFELAR